MSPARGVFVTGTDTGVGKTRTARALIAAAVGRGLRVAPMKPVACGASRSPTGWVNADVEQLLAAANLTPPHAQVNPFLYHRPISPHLAADEANQPINLETVRQAYAALAARADLVVVEGVGGWLVPLGPGGRSGADLAAALALPVVLTVGIRLGCLNHALLTASAIRAAGLELAGWVPSLIDPALSHLADNLHTLDTRLGVPRLGLLPHDPAPSLESLAGAVDTTFLV